MGEKEGCVRGKRVGKGFLSWDRADHAMDIKGFADGG
jgi:hypothetical protein